MSIRRFALTDLIWLEPIAKQYGEWESMLRTLERASRQESPNTFWVVEPYSIAGSFWDGCKGDMPLCFVGLQGDHGMKHFVKLVRDLVEGKKLHGHWKPGTWQGQLAERVGFELKDGIYVKTS